MLEFLNDVWTFMTRVQWGRVFVTIVATAIAVVCGIWFPARMLEQHTNQPAARYVWCVAGTMTIVVIYVCMYGYGHFWTLYSESPETQRLAPLGGE